ncbi:hypothetical protein BBO99_00008045 [Phytophthora kernoviae]|uniref:Mannosyl-oligosaccharide glucosidase n=1 Tax=Phytophthora kernoviae TaxID=325452 RepID=A0A3R7KQT4_9STRA|nr:hypothetical protein BBI17_007966 [Phytophthora kernoviae]RLN75821.1 hypothetical protein BBO99_00008045 [Phytophthora kernoviae]
MNSLQRFRWGTFRPGLYLGLRSRTQSAYVSAGLLWGSQHEDVSQLRHQCRQEDRLQRYGWLQHDGSSYGLQTVEDQYNRVELTTSYARLHSDDTQGWAARVKAAPLTPRDERLRRKQVENTKLSLFFYVDLGCGDESLQLECKRQLQNLMEVMAEPNGLQCGEEDQASCVQMVLQSEGPELKGETEEEEVPLTFQMQVQLKTQPTVRSAELRYAGLKDTNLINVKERLVALAERPGGEGKKNLKADKEIQLENFIEEGSSIVIVQAIVDVDAATFKDGDVVLDVLFNEVASSSASELVKTPIDHVITGKLAECAQQFEDKFEQSFHLSTKTWPAGEGEVPFNASVVKFAKAAFSNLVGGTGYFYGSSLVQYDPENPEVVESPVKSLFTAVPSRSFFPRGFVWDEGFHQIGISAFDASITRDVLAHWFGLMDEDGYIAREQTLGQDARRRVPTEFLVQHVEHANPPTLLLSLEKMLLRHKAGDSDDKELQKFVRLIFPFLKRWYSWFLKTQSGPLDASFRWRGRRLNDGKLISNTLSSGLDDYPRASLPSDREMHVDLLSWMIHSSEIMANLASFIDLDNEVQRFELNRAHFFDGLDKHHWNDEAQAFFDVGDHSEDGVVEYQVSIRCRNDQGQVIDATAPFKQIEAQQVTCPPTHPNFMFPLGDGRGGLQTLPVFIPRTTKLQHVKHIGYVSMFPLLLKVLPPDSPKLLAVLKQLTDPAHLWSPFGLRSLSTQDPFFEQENAPGDNPYWRGAIWMNANYLALDALHHYSQPSIGSPYQAAFAEAYAELRANVISNVYREYERTGYLWEQYSGDIHSTQQYGRGQRCHPFSGWTALVVNIMAEIY